MTDNCGSCRFAKDMDGTEAILCRAMPPTVTSVVGQTVTSHWPLLGKGEWCGRYEKAPRKKALK